MSILTIFKNSFDKVIESHYLWRFGVLPMAYFLWIPRKVFLGLIFRRRSNLSMK
jgi:hypothetical protein